MVKKKELNWDDELILLVPYHDTPGMSWGDEGISVKIRVGALLKLLITNHSHEVGNVTKHDDIEWHGDIPYPVDAMAWMGDI